MFLSRYVVAYTFIFPVAMAAVAHALAIATGHSNYQGMTHLDQVEQVKFDGYCSLMIILATTSPVLQDMC